MKVRRVIRKEIRHAGDGVTAAGQIDAVISVNVNEAEDTAAKSSQDAPIVQRSARAARKDERRKPPSVG